MNRLDNKDSLALAELLAKKMKADLMAEDTSSVTAISNLLSEFDAEIIHIALKIVPLEVVVFYDLDRNKSFNNLIKIVVKKLDSIPYEQAESNNHPEPV